MVSDRKLAANRANAARSTGPKTARGKARAARNGRKHGLAGEEIRLTRAERGKLRREIARWSDHFRPEDDLEARLVARAALATVVLDRIQAIDEAAWAEASRTGEPVGPEVFRFVVRYEARWVKELHRSLKALETIMRSRATRRSAGEEGSIHAPPTRAEEASNPPIEAIESAVEVDAVIAVVEEVETSKNPPEPGVNSQDEPTEIRLQTTIRSRFASKLGWIARIAASFLVGSLIGAAGTGEIEPKGPSPKSPDWPQSRLSSSIRQRDPFFPGEAGPEGPAPPEWPGGHGPIGVSSPGMARFSIIVPTHDDASTVLDALRSVDRAVARLRDEGPGLGGVPCEVIIVDDGSKDETPSLVAGHAKGRGDIAIVRRPAASSAACARNIGAGVARGDVLLFLDADDAFAEGHLLACARALADPAVDYVKTGVALDDPVHPDWHRRIANSLVINLAVRRRCHDLIGGFPDWHLFRRRGDLFLRDFDVFHALEDVFYNKALDRFFRCARLADETVRYARHPGNSFDRQYAKFRDPVGKHPIPDPPDRQFQVKLCNLLFQRQMEELGRTLPRRRPDSPRPPSPNREGQAPPAGA